MLLDKFRTTSRAVLLGTNSFWEGVDVKGTALSAVLIDKIPVSKLCSCEKALEEAEF